MFTEIYARVTGRVQGVGYRDYIATYALEHALVGWIENQKEGGVHVVLQGMPDQLKAAIEALNEGSLLARVDSLAIEWRTPQKLFDDFAVIAT